MSNLGLICFEQKFEYHQEKRLNKDPFNGDFLYNDMEDLLNFQEEKEILINELDGMSNLLSTEILNFLENNREKI